MSISNIKEESERLKDYIIMEQEKLREAKYQFEEDCGKFNEYLEQMNMKNGLLNQENERVKKEKNALHRRTEELQYEVKEVQQEIKRQQSTLEEFAKAKEFVDQVKTHSQKEEPNEEQKFFITQNANN